MSDDELLYQVHHTAYCAGFIVRGNRVVEAAPILKRKILFLPAHAAIRILVAAGGRVEAVTAPMAP